MKKLSEMLAQIRNVSPWMRRSLLPGAMVLTALLAGCSPTPEPARNLERATTMEEAREAPDQLRNLDLYYRRLPAFPPEILMFKNLEKLTLRTCTIGELPADIATLTKIQYLDLGESHLTNLTASVTALTNLTRLWLNDNTLTTLPPGLDRLSNLMYLNLDRNRLTSLPADIGHLSSLKWLRLNHNQLSALPADLSGLAQNLEILYLMGNPISEAERMLTFSRTCELKLLPDPIHHETVRFLSYSTSS